MHSKRKLSLYVSTLGADENVISEQEKGRYLSKKKPFLSVCSTVTLFFQSYPALLLCRGKVFPVLSFKLSLQNSNNGKNI